MPGEWRAMQFQGRTFSAYDANRSPRRRWNIKKIQAFIHCIDMFPNLWRVQKQKVILLCGQTHCFTFVENNHGHEPTQVFGPHPPKFIVFYGQSIRGFSICALDRVFKRYLSVFNTENTVGVWTKEPRIQANVLRLPTLAWAGPSLLLVAISSLEDVTIHTVMP